VRRVGHGLAVVVAIADQHHRAARVTHPQHASTTFRYCTNFAVTGSALEQRRYVQALEQIGDSVLVVGDPTTLKVHVHTDDPDAATALFAEAGVVSHLDVADMREQVQRRDDRLEAAAVEAVCGALAVVNGDGLREMFGELGVHTVDGGPTLNPSTYDLLAGIHEVPAEEVERRVQQAARKLGGQLRVPGFRNLLFGGEGLFLASLTGPGHIALQSMPILNLAEELLKFLAPQGNNFLQLGVS